MARQRSWTDADLIAAVRDADTLVEVLARLGLSIGGATMTRVRRRMLELGLDDPRLLGNARSAAKAQILRLGLDTAHFGQVRFSKPVKISRSGAVARGTRRGWQRR